MTLKNVRLRDRDTVYKDLSIYTPPLTHHNHHTTMPLTVSPTKLHTIQYTVPIMTKPLPPGKTRRELEALKPGESIWNRKAFPSATKQFKRLTPTKLKNALDRYSQNTEPLLATLSKAGCTQRDWYTLRQIYPEIESEYQLARSRKAKAYGDAALDLYQQPIPAEFFETSRGDTKLSNAGMTYLRDKAHILLRHAQIAETGSYVERRQIDQRSVAITAHVELTMAQLEGMSLEDLATLQVERRRGAAT